MLTVYGVEDAILVSLFEVMDETGVCVLMMRLEYRLIKSFHVLVTRRYGHRAPAL